MAHSKVDVSDVEAIFDTELANAQLQAFVDDAHLFISDVLHDKGLSADRLQQIEKYWAAGLAELRDPRKESARGAATQIDYKQSSYFERAIMLDTTGTLRALTKEDRVQFRSTTRAGPLDESSAPAVTDLDE